MFILYDVWVLSKRQFYLQLLSRLNMSCIIRIMTASESQFLEYKTSLGEIKSIVESVAAFATSQGGTICVGIAPDGKRVGVQLGRTTLEDLARDIKINTEPQQYPSITFEGIDNNVVINVQVDASPIKPVFAYGKSFIRVGRSNQQLSRDEIMRLMEQTTGHTWDAMPLAELSINDLSTNAIHDFLKRAGLYVDNDINTMLRNLAMLTSQGQLVNAVALLFTDNPHYFFPQAQLQCARFAGTTSLQFIDEATYSGSIFTQLDSALQFITRNTKQAIKITGKLEHEVIPEYPVDAMREAIINAICHRNYTEPGMVQVRIYDNRLEVWNPGSLPPELSIEQLYHEHSSHPRNPRLAGVFHRAKLVEKWGTGTTRIINACRTHGLTTPDFVIESGMFIVRFTVSTQLINAFEEPLNNRLQKAITFIFEKGSINVDEYQTEFNVSRRQAQRDLKQLVQNGSIIVDGKGPTTRYIAK